MQPQQAEERWAPPLHAHERTQRPHGRLAEDRDILMALVELEASTLEGTSPQDLATSSSSQISRRRCDTLSDRQNNIFGVSFAVVLDDPVQEASPPLPLRLVMGEAPGASTTGALGVRGPSRVSGFGVLHAAILVRLSAWLV